MPPRAPEDGEGTQRYSYSDYCTTPDSRCDLYLWSFRTQKTFPNISSKSSLRKVKLLLCQKKITSVREASSPPCDSSHQEGGGGGLAEEDPAENVQIVAFCLESIWQIAAWRALYAGENYRGSRHPHPAKKQPHQFCCNQPGSNYRGRRDGKSEKGDRKPGRGGQKTRVQIWRLWTMAMAGVGGACQASLLCCGSSIWTN